MTAALLDRIEEADKPSEEAVKAASEETPKILPYRKELTFATDLDFAIRYDQSTAVALARAITHYSNELMKEIEKFGGAEALIAQVEKLDPKVPLALCKAIQEISKKGSLWELKDIADDFDSVMP